MSGRTQLEAQPPLFPPVAAELEARLGSNQRLVLAAIREHRRVEPDEAGAIIHASRGRHPADRRCDYCEHEGLQVLASLSRRGFRNGKRQKTTGPQPGDLPQSF